MARLIREHLRITRELAAARAVLQFAEQQGISPIGWEEQLQALKATPQYNAIGEELEPVIVRLEQEAEETDLNELLEKLPKGSPTH